MKVSKGGFQPEIAADLRLLNSLHGSGPTMFIPGFDFKSSGNSENLFSGEPSVNELQANRRLELGAREVLWDRWASAVIQAWGSRDKNREPVFGGAPC